MYPVPTPAGLQFGLVSRKHLLTSQNYSKSYIIIHNEHRVFTSSRRASAAWQGEAPRIRRMAVNNWIVHTQKSGIFRLTETSKVFFWQIHHRMDCWRNWLGEIITKLAWLDIIFLLNHYHHSSVSMVHTISITLIICISDLSHLTTVVTMVFGTGWHLAQVYEPCSEPILDSAWYQLFATPPLTYSVLWASASPNPWGHAHACTHIPHQSTFQNNIYS